MNKVKIIKACTAADFEIYLNSFLEDIKHHELIDIKHLNDPRSWYAMIIYKIK